MTVGGKTIGRVTTVSMISARRDRVWLSQCANGSPITPNTNVVIAARRSVKPSDCQSAGDRPRNVADESTKA